MAATFDFIVFESFGVALVAEDFVSPDILNIFAVADVDDSPESYQMTGHVSRTVDVTCDIGSFALPTFGREICGS